MSGRIFSKRLLPAKLRKVVCSLSLRAKNSNIEKMSSKVTFYIVRHVRTLMNTLDRVQGWCDSPLTAEGIAMATNVGRGMQHIPFRSAYCSTLRRTLQTTKEILSAKGQSNIEISEIDGFKEACFGSFESDTNPHMWGSAGLYLGYRSLDALYQALVRGEITYREIMKAIQEIETLGIAESFEQVEERSQEALRTLAEQEAIRGEDANVLIVSHGVCICCMLMSLGGEELLKGHLENASVCKVIYQDGNFTVESMNDMSFYENGKLA